MLDFYYAQLESIVQYRSLRTDVFQSFKEIGNAILFCLIVEQCLVSQAMRARRALLNFWYSFKKPISSLLKVKEISSVLLQEVEVALW